MNKKTVFMLIFTSAILAVIIAITTTFSIWMQNAGESKYLEFDVVDENPSAKYQIFVPIDINGDRISGSLNVINREYTLANPSDINNVAGYALIGWDGGVSVSKVIITGTYTMKIEGQNVSAPVRRAMVISEYSAYSFSGDDIITELEIPANMIKIDSGVFSFMSQLTKVRFTGSQDIAIGDYAFAACGKLSIIDRGNRTIIGNEQLIWG